MPKSKSQAKKSGPDCIHPPKPGVPKPTKGKALSFKLVKQSSYSAIKQRSTRVSRGRVQTAGLKDELAKAKVDLRKEMIVEIYMGEFSNGGHSVTVTSVCELNGQIEVHTKEEHPRNGSSSAMSAPSCAIAIKKSTLPVVFPDFADAMILPVRPKRPLPCKL